MLKKVPEVLMRSLARTVFFFLGLASMYSCNRSCEKLSPFPASEFDCIVVDASIVELGRFLDSDSSLSNMIHVTKFNREPLLKPDELILFASGNATEFYKIIGVSADHYLVETYSPLPEFISFAPKLRRYRMKVCSEEIQIFGDGESNKEEQGPILIFEIII